MSNIYQTIQESLESIRSFRRFAFGKDSLTEEDEPLGEGAEDQSEVYIYLSQEKLLQTMMDTIEIMENAGLTTDEETQSYERTVKEVLLQFFPINNSPARRTLAESMQDYDLEQELFDANNERDYLLESVRENYVFSEESEELTPYEVLCLLEEIGTAKSEEIAQEIQTLDDYIQSLWRAIDESIRIRDDMRYFLSTVSGLLSTEESPRREVATIHNPFSDTEQEDELEYLRAAVRPRGSNLLSRVTLPSSATHVSLSNMDTTQEWLYTPTVADQLLSSLSGETTSISDLFPNNIIARYPPMPYPIHSSLVENFNQKGESYLQVKINSADAQAHYHTASLGKPITQVRILLDGKEYILPIKKDTFRPDLPDL